MPREKRKTEKTLMRAPVQPPREACEREYRSKQGTEGKTEAKGDGTKPARNNRKQIFIKEGQANYGKQMKSRVRHLV